MPNPRIFWSDMATKAQFTLANENETIYINNTCYVMTNAPKHFLGVLNSKLLEWYFFQIATNLGQGARFFKQFVELLPIPQITPQNETIIKHIVQSVEQIINNTDETQKNTISQQIDQWVYKLYGLTDEEIKIVEQA